jgi:hypothetical protein
MSACTANVFKLALLSISATDDDGALEEFERVDDERGERGVVTGHGGCLVSDS